MANPKRKAPRSFTSIDYVPRLTRAEVIAIQMTADPQEDAEPEQQAMAIKAIVEILCVINIEPVRETASYEDANFLSGRVFVGREIMKQIRRKIADMPNENEVKPSED